MRYRATTSARDKESGQLTFAGKIYGVRFQQGTALFDDLTIDKIVGLSAEDVAFHMKNEFGIQIEKLDDSGKPLDEEAKPKRTKAKE
jgi:hypothetical protein